MADRQWNISTLGNGVLVVNLVSVDPPHVVNVLVSPTLPAAEIARVLEHCENAMNAYIASVAAAQVGTTVILEAAATPAASEPRMRGVWAGSLTVTAADGTDITQPPSEPTPAP